MSKQEKPSGPLTYRGAGVDIDASDDAKHRITKLVESTYTAGTRGAFGGFGGMFRMPEGMKKPLLVSSADGVGTKIKVAIEAGRHDTIGHCLVNHCVNDILVQGAEPLFFLDYVAFGALVPKTVEAVVAGVAAGCRENGCALMGGETAEMPGLYTPPDYDLAGFIVGCVEEDRVMGSARVKEGDVLTGIASSGLHTNGFSLARQIIERMGLSYDDQFPGSTESVADTLLAVHRSYLGLLRPVLADVNAMAHITGGGLPGNLNRVLPLNMDAAVDTSSWEIPNLFRVLAEQGAVEPDEMFRAFNMGVGMVVISNTAQSSRIQEHVRAQGVPAWTMGKITKGTGRVILNGGKV
jgi:phosphoribosylformylglycinamidine cyclo-ligase